MDADVVVVGAGLAGLVATAELADAGRRVVVLDQEPEASLGGQAFWSFGGLFLVDSPEQRRMGIRDSLDLALQDWLGSAAFDRGVDDPAGEDHWARQWATAYVDFACGEKRAWLHGLGVRFFPVVGWAERGGHLADGHGNSVPRFHVVWGTGPGLLEPFVRRVRQAVAEGRVELRFRHRVDGLTTTAGAVDGVTGTVLAHSTAPRGRASSREPIGTFALRAQAVLVTSGGIGADHDLVRAFWPDRLGYPARADDLRRACARRRADARDRREGRRAAGEPRPHVALHRGRRELGPDLGAARHPDPAGALGAVVRRPGSTGCPRRTSRGSTPSAPLRALRATGHDHSWFVLTMKILEKEFALSGSEQNPDLTGRSVAGVLRRVRPGPAAPVRAFLDRGADFVVADSLPDLVAGMNALTDEPLIDLGTLERQIVARDRELANPFTKDLQVMAIHNARRHRGDRLLRTAEPHRILDPAAGPLIAVRLHVLTRKTLGGLQTDLSCRVLDAAGAPIDGLYAAGEVAGFGGGGVHGYRALEGTFLGGCLFGGRRAGRAAALAVR